MMDYLANIVEFGHFSNLFRSKRFTVQTEINSINWQKNVWSFPKYKFSEDKACLVPYTNHLRRFYIGSQDKISYQFSNRF